MIETCPSPDQLEAYCLGYLSAVQADELEQHLRECKSCEQRISTVESAEDALVVGLRHVHSDPPINLDSEAHSLIHRALEIPHPGSTRIGSDTDSGQHSYSLLDAESDKSLTTPRRRASETATRIVESAVELQSELVACGLATNEEAAAWRAEFVIDSTDVDAFAFAQALVEHQRLTLFQARQLLLGRGRELKLDDYLILDELGHGGMGSVLRAQHVHMARQVAIKVLADRLFDQEEMAARFQREIRIAASLSHPHVVTAFDARESNGRRYLVMELVDGTDLNALVRQRHPLPMETIVDSLLQAAQGLAAAHDVGLVHRDVKPSNLLVSHGGQIKVTDLGLARSSDPQQADDRLTESGIVLGTLDFIAPEQAFDADLVDGRADVYGLGWTLYFLVNGNVPFQDRSRIGKVMAHRNADIPPLSDQRTDIPAALDQLFRQMVEKQPADRPADMYVVCEALERIKEQIGQPPSPESLVPAATPNLDEGLDDLARAWEQARQRQNELSQPAHRQPRRVAMWTAAALIGLVILGVVYSISRSPKQSTGELAIRVDDESRHQVAVKVINNDGGDDLTFDASAGWNGDLEPGNYRLELVRGGERFDVAPQQLDVTADGFHAVTVSPKPVLPAIHPADKPLGGDDSVASMPGEIAKIEIAPQVHCLALSPAGDIGFASFQRNIYVVDLLAQKIKLMIAGHQKTIGHLVCSPDDTYLASCSVDRTVCVWDGGDYERIARIRLPVIPLRARFSPDGTQLVVAVDLTSRDLSLPPNSPVNIACQSLMMFESRTGRRLAQLTRDREIRFSALDYSPDGSLIAAGSVDGQIVLINVAEGKETLRMRTSVPGPIQDIQFSQDGTSFYTLENGDTGKANLVLRRSVAKGKELSRWPLDFIASRLDVLPDGMRLLINDASDIVVMNASDSVSESLLGHEGLISDLFFRLDGQQAVSAGRDGTVRLWQLPSLEEQMPN